MKKVLSFALCMLSTALLASCNISLSKSTLIRSNKYTYADYADNSYLGTDSCPSVGDIKLLVIPVWLAGIGTGSYIYPSNKNNVKSDIEKAYIGTKEETGWHSVLSFYEEESFGKCKINATITDWYISQEVTKDYYTDPLLTRQLVIDASNWYFDNNTNDKRQNYDADKDGYLDGVILIYGCPDLTQLPNGAKDYPNLSAYTSWIQDDKNKNTANPGANAFCWISYDFMYDSETAKQRCGTTYGSGNTANCHIDAHAFIHETGHLLGLTDYYDYSMQYVPSGGFSMQDYNIGGHDPYSIMALGWLKPIVPSISCKTTINAFQDSHDVILLSQNYKNSCFDEYLLLELYTPTGLNEFDATYRYKPEYPVGSQKPGIRLWHVDARLAVSNHTYIEMGFPQSFERFDPAYLTTNPKTKDAKVIHAFSNTYYGNVVSDGYASPCGRDYSDYNLLHLIRNDTSNVYSPTTLFNENDLFYEGDTFSIQTYQSQFVNKGRLNGKSNFKWSFKVESLSSESATISCFLK